MSKMNRHSLLKSIDSQNLVSKGLFDPRFCIIVLQDFPDRINFRDPMSFESLSSESEHKDTWRKMTDVFSKAGYQSSKIEKYNPLRTSTYYLSPTAYSETVFGEYKGFVFNHEFLHFLQFIRSPATPFFIHAFTELFNWGLQINPQELGEKDLPIPDKNAWWFWQVILWYYTRPNFLTASDIKESEAEMMSLMYGKNTMRFKKYMLGNVVAIHFRELAQQHPRYARAYIEAESALRELVSSLFPLLAYFSLSMPLKSEDNANKNNTEIATPEEAFVGAIECLQNNPEIGHEYYFTAYDLYKYSHIDLNAKNCVVKEFCREVCRYKNWTFNSTGKRKHLIDQLDRIDRPFTDRISKLLKIAVDIESEYGAIIFLEPYNKTCSRILKEIPLPPLLIPQNDFKEFRILGSDFWGKDYIQDVQFMKLVCDTLLNMIFLKTS